MSYPKIEDAPKVYLWFEDTNERMECSHYWLIESWDSGTDYDYCVVCQSKFQPKDDDNE